VGRFGTEFALLNEKKMWHIPNPNHEHPEGGQSKSAGNLYAAKALTTQPGIINIFGIHSRRFLQDAKDVMPVQT
jgi:hypothetical protein